MNINRNRNRNNNSNNNIEYGGIMGREEILKRVAKHLVEKSARLEEGENLLIEIININSLPLVYEIIEEARKKKANVYTNIVDKKLNAKLLKNTNKTELETWADFDKYRMEKMDAYLGITSVGNKYDMKNVDNENLNMYSAEYVYKVHLEERVNNTKWCILNYPTEIFADSFKMDDDEFFEFWGRASTIDYQDLERKLQPLKELLDRTDSVRIVGKNTDISFSIKDIPSTPCTGMYNLPDGEIFTAPVRDSVNGHIHYNTKTMYNGVEFENIFFRFENGKIVEARSDINTDKLNDILNMDDGARYIGEFAIGVNPEIKEIVNNTLYDEKIAGSFHFTPGSALMESDNGNRSKIHWDIVYLEKEDEESKMYFDDVLVREKGRFVLDELQELNV